MPVISMYFDYAQTSRLLVQIVNVLSNHSFQLSGIFKLSVQDVGGLQTGRTTEEF